MTKLQEIEKYLNNASDSNLLCGLEQDLFFSILDLLKEQDEILKEQDELLDLQTKRIDQLERDNY